MAFISLCRPTSCWPKKKIVLSFENYVFSKIRFCIFCFHWLAKTKSSYFPYNLVKSGGNISIQIKSKTIIYSVKRKVCLFSRWMNRSLDFLKKRRNKNIYTDLTYVAFLIEGPNLSQSTYTICKHFTRNWPNLFYAMKMEQARII